MSETNSNRRKHELLGMNYGTAFGRLRKQIMFSMAKKLDVDWCFRCGSKIESIEEFSVEHKQPWQAAPDPVASFFDLENIAFSHNSCNSAAARQVNKKYDSTMDQLQAKWRRARENPISKERRNRLKRDRYRYAKINSRDNLFSIPNTPAAD